jgi:hypothetical protein
MRLHIDTPHLCFLNFKTTTGMTEERNEIKVLKREIMGRQVAVGHA